jgi:hypothetical protein
LRLQELFDFEFDQNDVLNSSTQYGSLGGKHPPQPPQAPAIVKQLRRQGMICIGVPELPPQRKREYLDKCDNLNFQEKKIQSQTICNREKAF